MASLLGPAAFIANHKRKLTTPDDESQDDVKKKDRQGQSESCQTYFDLGPGFANKAIPLGGMQFAHAGVREKTQTLRPSIRPSSHHKPIKHRTAYVDNVAYHTWHCSSFARRTECERALTQNCASPAMVSRTGTDYVSSRL